MNKLTMAALSCVLSLPIVAGSAAALDSYFFVTSAGSKEDLEIRTGAAYAKAKGESRGPVAGRHQGQTYIGTREATSRAQVYANVRCGKKASDWARGPIVKYNPWEPERAVTTACALDRQRAEVWEAEVEWQ